MYPKKQAFANIVEALVVVAVRSRYTRLARDIFIQNFVLCTALHRSQHTGRRQACRRRAPRPLASVCVWSYQWRPVSCIEPECSAKHA